MRKLFYFFLIASLLSLLFLGGWAVYQTSQGKNVTAYSRLMTNDGFNWRGIISPLQVEAEKRSTDSIDFDAKVAYPYGKDFEVIAPKGTPEENVALKIQKIIETTKDSIRIRYYMNYDGSSEEVRAHQQQAESISVRRELAHLALHGTASPEAHEDGFETSVLPGNFEEKNAQLAKGRVMRTARILDSLGYMVNETSSEELQFATVAASKHAIAHPEILDDMRYVEAHGTIVYEKVSVETMTMPWLLPLWIVLALWALSLLRRLRAPQMPSLKFGTWQWKGSLWNWLLLILKGILVIILSWIILVFLLIPLFGIVGYLILLALLLIIIFFWRILRFLGEMLFILWEVIVACLFFARDWLIQYVRHLRREWRHCWNYLNHCWKRTFLIMSGTILLLIVVIICLI